MHATYSPDDNKLRIHPSERLDDAEYQAAKDAGFRWAPKQGVFYATWSPKAEDYTIALCGEIGDDDETLLERSEERAERFEGYAESRMRDSAAAEKSARSVADAIPFGQPIIVGHHSEKRTRRDYARIQEGFRKSVKMWETAQYWERRAKASIQHAKYKDLPQVRARRIKKLEAELRKAVREGWGRWISHLSMRVTYERTILEAQDGLALLEKPKRPKPPPLLNYCADGPVMIWCKWRKEPEAKEQRAMTKADYKAIRAESRWTVLSGDKTHRLRYAVVGPMTKAESFVVFLTDSKVHPKP